MSTDNQNEVIQGVTEVATEVVTEIATEVVAQQSSEVQSDKSGMDKLSR